MRSIRLKGDQGMRVGMRAPVICLLAGLVSLSLSLSSCFGPTLATCRIPCVETADCPSSFSCNNGFCADNGGVCVAEAKDAASETSGMGADDQADGRSSDADDARDGEGDQPDSTGDLVDGVQDVAPSPDSGDGPRADREEVTDADGSEVLPDLPPEIPEPTWTPSDLSGLRLWLDASELIPGPLVRWPDKSGHGHDATPLSLGAPTVVIDAGNNLATVEMLGVRDLLTMAGDFSDFTAGMSVFLVVFPRVSFSPQGNQPPYYTHLIDLGTTMGLHEDSILISRGGAAESELEFYVYVQGENAAGFVIGEAVGNFSWQLLEGVMEGGLPGGPTAGRLFRNGLTVVSGTLLVPRIVARRSNLLGGSNFRTDTGIEVDGHFRGRFGEVILFARSLTDAERRRVEEYLGAKWRPQ
jgi:hypothetical protein